VSSKKILVIGAGFAGAVHARLLAEAGLSVDVIDKRAHIAGNAFDFIDTSGISVHAYGPHLFHTNKPHVMQWLQSFAEFIPYFHRVKADAGGTLVSLPINIDTLSCLFDVELTSEEDARRYLSGLAVKVTNVSNAADYLYSRIGTRLTDLFFRPYTKKMWSLELEELDASVVKRIPIRYDKNDKYFPNDKHQALPRDGYTALFRKILEHPLISTTLNTSFSKEMEKEYRHTFASMPIDEYFDNCYGELPYRSIKFTSQLKDREPGKDWAVTNFTDNGIYTRETQWDLIPGPHISIESKQTLFTKEIPCDYKENNYERYYPVKVSDDRYKHLYSRYRDLSDAIPHITFIGRCGTYQYLDMDQVIADSLTSANKWLHQFAASS